MTDHLARHIAKVFTRHMIAHSHKPSDMPNIFLFSHVDLAEALYTVNILNVLWLLGSVVSVAGTNLNYVSNMVWIQFLLVTFFFICLS